MNLAEFEHRRSRLSHIDGRLLMIRCKGESSNAMTVWAFEPAHHPRPRIPGRAQGWKPGQLLDGYILHGDECPYGCPMDESDLQACIATLWMASGADAPAEVIDRMRELVVEFAGWVRGGINRYGERMVARSRP